MQNIAKMNIFYSFSEGEPGASITNKPVSQSCAVQCMYKWFVWRATRPVNKADCMSEWRYFLKYNRNVSIISTHLQYLPSFMQSAMFTGHLARQTICLYVLHMIMKLAYWQFNCIIFGKEQ